MFTEEQKKAYFDAAGNMCPYCKSTNITALGRLNCDDSGTAEQEVECVTCGRRWGDIYTLSGIIHEDVLNAI